MRALGCSILLLSTCANAEDLDAIMHRCAPSASVRTLKAIVQVESSGNPYALNVNNGYKLKRQPQNYQEAVQWANWLVKNGYNVDMGLAQINSQHLKRLGLTPAALIEPCTNIQVAATILSDNFRRAGGKGQTALLKAISEYNTGNHVSGFKNGYVARVAYSAGVSLPKAAPRRVSAQTSALPERTNPLRNAALVVYAAN